MAVRGSWAVLVAAPLLLLAEGTARADAPSFGPGLRPYIHTDGRGRKLVDVCPEVTRGQPRCALQRVLQPGEPEPTPVPLLGGLTCGAGGPTGAANPTAGSMTPSDILMAYSIPSTAKANGAIVAVVDLPSTNSMLDANTYRTYFGIPTLPACPTNTAGVPTPALAEGGTAHIPCFARVGPDGTVNTVSPLDCSGGPSQETSLDVEMVSALCPDCSIVVVETPRPDNSLWTMSAIASPSSCPGGVVGASAVSTSWVSPESGGDDDTPFSCPDIMAVTGSGDTGYMFEADIKSGGIPPAGLAYFPASSPHVLGVGGTTLSPFLEVVWDDASSGYGGSTGSGCSSEYAMPSYQSTSPFHFGTCKKRASSDISAAAEWNPGSIAVYNYDSGGWAAYTGTSASSPIVAAIMVRLGLGGKDQHTLFYKNGGAFNDITSGNNDSLGICGGTVMCTAGKGWDGPTGIGSPNGTLLLALAGGTLEPEPDAGSDSGPPPDAGKDSGGTMDSGSDAGSDGGHKPPPKHGIGAPCTQSFQCSGSDQCVSPGGSKPTVCAPICDTSTPCPSGYGCQGGYCFAGSAPADAGTGNKATPASSSGCGCTTAPAKSPWATAGWLLLGLVAWTRRRRR